MITDDFELRGADHDSIAGMQHTLLDARPVQESARGTPEVFNGALARNHGYACMLSRHQKVIENDFAIAGSTDEHVTDDSHLSRLHSNPNLRRRALVVATVGRRGVLRLWIAFRHEPQSIPSSAPLRRLNEFDYCANGNDGGDARTRTQVTRVARIDQIAGDDTDDASAGIESGGAVARFLR